MRHGTVFSITGTASGQLFAAWLGEAARPLYEAERRASAKAGPSGTSGTLPTWARFTSTTLAEVREQGLARADGAVVAGVSALAAPVLDHRGAIVLALTAIGPSAALDTGWDGSMAALLRHAAAAASARLGYRAGGLGGDTTPANPPGAAR
jgi:DNA-binding IclR family transcriptional regulator